MLGAQKILEIYHHFKPKSVTYVDENTTKSLSFRKIVAVLFIGTYMIYCIYYDHYKYHKT